MTICKNCNAQIPPEWTNAIRTGVCPGCGGALFDEKEKELMDELAAAMERMPNDPQGIVGWLMSNYKFYKIGDAIPTEKFHRKGQSIPEEGLKIDPTYNEFLKRTGESNKVQQTLAVVERVKNKNSKFAGLIEEIKNAGDPYEDNEQEEVVADSDEVRAYAELKKQGFDPFANTPVGGLSNISDMSDAISQNDIKNLIRQNQNDEPLPLEKVIASTAEGSAILQRERFKKLKAQEAIEGGGGSFRR
jgi:hypothetical protein